MSGRFALSHVLEWAAFLGVFVKSARVWWEFQATIGSLSSSAILSTERDWINNNEKRKRILHTKCVAP